FPRRIKQPSPKVVVYTDDLVVLHKDRQVADQCQQLVSEWLRPMDLTLKLSKTRITHTFETGNGQPGFDFLGFYIRQYAVGKTRSGRDNRDHRLGFKTLIKPS